MNEARGGPGADLGVDLGALGIDPALLDPASDAVDDGDDDDDDAHDGDNGDDEHDALSLAGAAPDQLERLIAQHEAARPSAEVPAHVSALLANGGGEHNEGDDDDDIQVTLTDEDLTDPELLAELR